MEEHLPEQLDQEQGIRPSEPLQQKEVDHSSAEAPDSEPQSPPSVLNNETVAHQIKREVTQADLDRCYGGLEAILGMGEAAKGNDEDFDSLEDSELLDLGVSRRSGGRKKCLGIDIGETSIKLVQLGPNHQILTMDTAALEAGQTALEREASIVQALRSMIDHHKIKTRKAVLCLSEKSTHMRTAQIAAGNKTELQNTLDSETEKLELPEARENHVFNHIVFENGSPPATPGEPLEPTMTGLFFSTEREAVSRLVHIAKGARLKPIAFDIDALAAVRFYRQSYQGLENGTTVLAEMHASNTLLSFVEGRRLIWAKHLSTGSRDFTTGIAKALRIEEKEAENLKLGQWKETASFQDHKSDVIRAIEPVLNRLSGEIRRTVQFYLSQQKTRRVHRLVLAGAGSRIPGLSKDLSRLLELPVMRWGLTSRFDFAAVLPEAEALPDKLSRFAIALGLCLWDKAADPLNLLPGRWERLGMRRGGKKEASRGKRMTRIGMPRLPTGWPAFVGGALVLLLLGSSALFYTKSKGLKIRLEKEQSLLQDWNPIREDLARLHALRGSVAEKTARVETLRGQQVQLADGIAALGASVPSAVTLSAIRFEDKQFNISAYTVNTDAVQTLIDRLNRTHRFSEPVLKHVRKTEEHPGKSVFFELQFGLRKN